MAKLLIILSYMAGVLGILFYGASSLYCLFVLIFSNGSYGMITRYSGIESQIWGPIICLILSLICLVANILLIIGLAIRKARLIEGYLIIQGILFVLNFLFGLFQVVVLVFFWIGLAYDGRLPVFHVILLIVITLVILALIAGIFIGVFCIVWKAKKSIEMNNVSTFSTCYNSSTAPPKPIIHSVGQHVPANTPIELNHGNNSA